jgi:hypothetical protein
MKTMHPSDKATLESKGHTSVPSFPAVKGARAGKGAAGAGAGASAEEETCSINDEEK